jgi:NADPH:quinone reductase-like Zn-dependent oxidoreductase
MAQTGLLVVSWPFVPGVDASGVVVKVGENAASRFKIGDYICGCTRLGTKGHSTCQEYVRALLRREMVLSADLNVVLDGCCGDHP